MQWLLLIFLLLLPVITVDSNGLNPDGAFTRFLGPNGARYE